MMQEEMMGYIVGREARDVNGQINLFYWVKCAGGTIKVWPDRQYCVFFVEQEALTFLQSLASVRCEAMPLTAFDGKKVVAVFCNSLAHRDQLLVQLRQQQWCVYEEDVRPADRYLMERDIRAAVRFRGEFEQKMGDCLRARLKPAVFEPTWCVWSIDIETSVSRDCVLSIAIVGADFQRVLVVHDQPNDDPRCEFFSDETRLLLRFMRLMRWHDPDLLIGWNLIDFDLAFLDRRCQVLGLKPQFGVGGESWRLYRSQGRSRWQISIPGRVALDGIALLKVGGHHFDSYALDAVSQQLLGEGKLLQGAGRWQEIERLHAQDLPRFVDYNLQDCHLVAQIFTKLKLIELQQARVNLTGIDFSQMGGSVASFENLYIPRLHRAGYVAPAWSTQPFTSSPGGAVMSSQPGFYQNVLVFDFKSLYPSIIRTFCIDPLARVVAGDKRIEGFLGAKFTPAVAILPHLIGELAYARETAKQQQNTILSHAIKIIMNSFYGVLGSDVCRFYHAELASSITLRGQQVLGLTREWMLDRGHNVIYGDTDSLFICLNTASVVVENSQEMGRQLCQEMNRQWQSWCQDTYGIESYLELQFETLYERFYMPTIRGQAQGSKKRYAGLVNGQLVFKGLEAVRSDWTPLARRFQRELMLKIFQDENPQAYIDDFLAQLRAGYFDDELVYSKRLSRPLSSYVKTVPPQVRAAQMLVQQEGIHYRGQYEQPRQSIQYVYTLEGIRPYQGEQNGLALDYEHYVEKQVMPLAMAIVSSLSLDAETLIGPQMRLL